MLRRIALGLVLLVALAFAGLALYLPRLAQGPAVRARLESAARDATGREFRWRELDVGLLPPRVVLRGAELAGAAPDAPAFVEAGSVSLELAVLPLLARVVLVDSLVIEDATLRLRRTADGFEWPRPPEKPREPKRERPPDAEPRRKSERDAGMQLAVRDLELRGVRLLVEDDVVSPPVVWDLSELTGNAHAESLTQPIAFELTGKLGSGGRLRGSGSATPDGPLQLELVLEAVELAPLAAYVRDARTLSGGVSGSVRVQRGGDAPESLGAKLVVERGEVELEDVRVRGRIAADVELTGHPLSGPFKLDATGAELATGGSFSFVKPPGTPATAEGRIVPRAEGGFDVDDVKIQLSNANVQGRVQSAPRLSAELSAPAVELAGLEALLPALGGRALGGRLELRELAVATAPLEVHGRLSLDGVRASSPRDPPLELSGALVGRGGEIASEGLTLVAAGQPLHLSLLLGPLDPDPRLRLRANGHALDGRALAQAFAGSDAFEGPVTLDADLAAPLGGEAALLDAAAGRVRLDVGRGRLRGVSLLRQSFDALGAAAEVALYVNRARGSDKTQRFEQDEFESIAGTFVVGRGMARTDDLRLVYRGYTVKLRGTLGLADGRLDLTGDIVGEPELDAALSGEPAQPRGRPPLVIPLAHVVGTVAAPRVDLSPRAVASLGTRYGMARERGKLEQKLDQKLGPGAGRAVTDALDGLLGGKERR